MRASQAQLDKVLQDQGVQCPCPPSAPGARRLDAVRHRRRPAPELSVVSRPRLLALLDRSAQLPVTVVSGDAGSGKTLLVADWTARRGLPTAWVTCEPADGAADRLWSAVLTGLAATGPSAAALGALEPPGAVDGAFLDAVHDAVTELAGPVVLVLDDVHLVDGSLDGVVEVARRGSQLRLVLVGRGAAPVPLHRLRAAGRLVEGGPAELALDREEARQVLAAHGVQLPDDSLALLLERTRGWAVGVRLAALALAQARSGEQVLPRLGVAEPVADYLEGELLARLEPLDVDLLARASLLDPVAPVLVARLLPAPDPAALEQHTDALLARLCLDGALVSRLTLPGRPGPWYAVHPLLRELLLARLAGSDDVPGLHRRAALLLERDGQPLVALRHALDSGDWSLVAEIALRSAGAHLMGGDRGGLLELLNRVPPSRADGDPALTTALAAAAYCRYDLPDLLRHIAAADGTISRAGPSGTPRRDIVEVVLDLFRTALAKLAGDPAAMRAAAVSARETLGRIPPAELPAWDVYEDLAELMCGLSEVWLGELGAGTRRLAARDQAGRSPAVTAVHAQGFRALGLLLTGALPAAREVAGQTLARARRHGWDHAAQTEGSWAATALLALEQGDLAAGSAALETARSTVTPAPVDWFVRAATALAGVLERLLVAGPAAGRLAVSEAEAELGEHGEVGVLAAWSALAAADVELAAGDPRAALRRLGAVSPGARAPLAGRLDVLAARCYLAAGEPDRAAALLLSPDVAHLPDGPGRVELALAQALLADRRGDGEAARAALDAGLERAARVGSLRPFLLVAGPDAALVAEAVARNAAPTLAPLRGPRSPAPDAAPTAARLAAEGVTPREAAVLQLLPTRLTAAQIAARLHVTLNTVRHHQKALHRKLGVSTRGEAVDEAAARGLLPGSAAG